MGNFIKNTICDFKAHASLNNNNGNFKVHAGINNNGNFNVSTQKNNKPAYPQVQQIIVKSCARCKGKVSFDRCTVCTH